MMESLRADADLVIDTTGLTPHDLRDRMRETFAEAPPEAGLLVSIVSFGFKYGSPRDADLVMDVRFLPNPHWVDELRPSPGSNEKVREYVEGQEEYGSFMKRLEGLLDVVVPGYVDEGKSYLTVAIRVHRRPAPVGRGRGRPRRLLPRARPSRLGEPPRRRPRLRLGPPGRRPVRPAVAQARSTDGQPPRPARRMEGPRRQRAPGGSPR